MELRKCRRELSNGENNVWNDQDLYECWKCRTWNHRNEKRICPKCGERLRDDAKRYNVLKRKNL